MHYPLAKKLDCFTEFILFIAWVYIKPVCAIEKKTKQKNEHFHLSH